MNGPSRQAHLDVGNQDGDGQGGRQHRDGDGVLLAGGALAAGGWRQARGQRRQQRVMEVLHDQRHRA